MKALLVGGCALTAAMGLQLMPATAEDIQVQGVIAAITTAQEQASLSDGSTLLRVHQKGIIMDTGTPGPLDHNFQNCDGILVISPDGQHAPGNGYCEYIDKDGDRWGMWWETTDDVNKWGVDWGTGKFAGMTGGGGTTEISPYPEGDLINYQGTLHLKEQQVGELKRPHGTQP